MEGGVRYGRRGEVWKDGRAMEQEMKQYIYQRRRLGI